MSFEEKLISKTSLYDFYIRVHEVQVEMQSELSNYEGKVTCCQILLAYYKIRYTYK